MLSLFKRKEFQKKETPSLWTHNARENGDPSANNLTSSGKNYQSKMMNADPMKNLMFDRYFGIDETLETNRGTNFLVIGDEQMNVADRVFRHQIEQLKTSFVVSTSSLALVESAKGSLAKNGYQIRILNFSSNKELGNISNVVEQSMSYDMFEQAKDVEAVDKLVKILVRMSPMYSTDYLYFYDNVQSLIAATVLLKQMNNNANINSVIEFIQSAELITDQEKANRKNAFDAAFEEATLFFRLVSDVQKEQLIAACHYYKRFFDNSGKSRNYIVKCALDILAPYNNSVGGPKAVNYDIQGFANKKFALFIVIDKNDKDLAAHGRVVSQEIIYQFERESLNTQVRFMVDNIQEYLAADFASLIKVQGKFSFTTVLCSMENLSWSDEQSVNELDILSDVIIYMGSKDKSERKHAYVMELLGRIQQQMTDFSEVCQLAKKGSNNIACVYSPANRLTFDMSDTEQIIFVRGCKPFLTSSIY